MPEFFVVLKKRIGLGGAIMLFGIFRIGPFVLVVAIVPLGLLGEWLNAVMCFFLGFALLGTGLLMQVYMRNVLAREERQAQKSSTAANEAAAEQGAVVNKQQEPSSATNTVAPGRKPIICAMPKCEEVVSDLMHPLCLEHYDDWINKQKPNGPFYCAMPGCSVNTASKSQPLCKEHWREWSGQSR